MPDDDIICLDDDSGPDDSSDVTFAKNFDLASIPRVDLRLNVDVFWKECDARELEDARKKIITEHGRQWVQEKNKNKKMLFEMLGANTILTSQIKGCKNIKQIHDFISHKMKNAPSFIRLPAKSNRDLKNLLNYVVWFRMNEWESDSPQYFDSSFDDQWAANIRAEYVFFKKNPFGQGSEETLEQESTDIKAKNGMMYLSVNTGASGGKWRVQVSKKAKKLQTSLQIKYTEE